MRYVLNSLQTIYRHNSSAISETMDDKTRSLAFFVQAVDLDGSDLLVWYNIGRIASDLSKWNIARHALERALVLAAPATHWMSLERLIELLYVIGDHDSCRRQVDAALRIDPSNKRAELILALLLRPEVEASDEVREKVANILAKYKATVDDEVRAYLQSLVTRHEKIVQPVSPTTPQRIPEFLPSILPSLTWDALSQLLVSVYKERSVIPMAMNAMLEIRAEVAAPSPLEEDQAELEVRVLSPRTITSPVSEPRPETPVPESPATTTAPPSLTSSGTSVPVLKTRRAGGRAAGAAAKDERAIVDNEGYIEKLISTNKIMSPVVMAQLSIDDVVVKPPTAEQQQHHQSLDLQRPTARLIENTEGIAVSAFLAATAPMPVVDWMSRTLNHIAATESYQFPANLVKSLYELQRIIASHSSSSIVARYTLFFAELDFDAIVSAGANDTSVEPEHSSNLSFNLVKLTAHNRHPQDPIYQLRYKWLLARHAKHLGDIDLASEYLHECEANWPENKQICILFNCKNDKLISPSIISDKLKRLQDQSEKNRAAQLFTTGDFAGVIAILEPLFPGAFCLIDPATLEFKPKDIIDPQTKAKINKIDLLLQSYLSVSNVKGVLKMSIILLKELTTCINNVEMIYMLIKILMGEEDDINIPMNPVIIQSIGSIQAAANKKEYKDLIEKLYLKFPEAPDRVTKYKSIIDDYFDGKVEEITDLMDVASPPRVNFDLLFSKSSDVIITEPLFDDIYTDIYFMYASSIPNENMDLKVALIKKDLYSNPNRIESWTLLTSMTQKEITDVTCEDGIMAMNSPDVAEKIGALYTKLVMYYKHLVKLTPEQDETYSDLGLVIIAWAVRNQTTKDDYSSNALKEFMKIKPRTGRLSKGVWSLWNEGYLGDGKLDRYFKKYYTFYIQLLEENGEYTQLEIVHSKIRSDEKFKQEASDAYVACCRLLSKQIANAPSIHDADQLLPLVLETTATALAPVMHIDPLAPSIQDMREKIQEQQKKMIQSAWELYMDVSLYPRHRDQIHQLLLDSYHTFHSGNNRRHTVEEVIEIYEKRFSIKDKRKKKAPEPPIPSSQVPTTTPTATTTSTTSPPSPSRDNTKRARVDSSPLTTPISTPASSSDSIPHHQQHSTNS
eukprot:gene8375-9842_t